MNSLQKAIGDLSPLLDEDVTRYLSVEEMNQLLGACTGLIETMDQFARTVRKNLMSNDFGFMETYVFCALCGRRELIGSLTCSVCGSILKRCSDCGHYDKVYQMCGLHGFYVYASEAEAPSEDSHSYRCEDYKPRVEIGRAA
jgi:hypothetical protein